MELKNLLSAVEFTVSGEGLKARAFCHEIDHLSGILFKEKVVEFVEMDGE